MAKTSKPKKAPTRVKGCTCCNLAIPVVDGEHESAYCNHCGQIICFTCMTDVGYCKRCERANIRVVGPAVTLPEHYVKLDVTGSVSCRGDLDCVFCKIAKGK